MSQTLPYAVKSYEDYGQQVNIVIAKITKNKYLVLGLWSDDTFNSMSVRKIKGYWFMKIFTFIVVVSCFVSLTSESAQEVWSPFYFPAIPFSNSESLSPPDFIRSTDFSLWNSIVALGGRFQKNGTGVYVGEGIVITAAHVLRDIIGSCTFALKPIPLTNFIFPSTYDIYKNATVFHIASFNKSDQDFLCGKQPSPLLDDAIELNDWVVLKLPELVKRQSVKLHFAKEDITNLDGVTVWVAGYPYSGNGGLFLSAGRLTRNGVGKPFISQIQLKGGFSGGPVMTKNGTVIGLINTYYPSSGIATFVPLSKFKY